MKRAAAAAMLVALVACPAARASCVYMSPEDQREGAEAIFDGIALDGRTRSGIQRFRVTEYLKGDGPRIVGVETGQRVIGNGGLALTSVSLEVHRGESWRIYAIRGERGRFATNTCLGSRKTAIGAPFDGGGSNPASDSQYAVVAVVLAFLTLAAAVIGLRRRRRAAPQ